MGKFSKNPTKKRLASTMATAPASEARPATLSRQDSESSTLETFGANPFHAPASSLDLSLTAEFWMSFGGSSQGNETSASAAMPPLLVRASSSSVQAIDERQGGRNSISFPSAGSTTSSRGDSSKRSVLVRLGSSSGRSLGRRTVSRSSTTKNRRPSLDLTPPQKVPGTSLRLSDSKRWGESLEPKIETEIGCDDADRRIEEVLIQQQSRPARPGPPSFVIDRNPSLNDRERQLHAQNRFVGFLWQEHADRLWLNQQLDWLRRNRTRVGRGQAPLSESDVATSTMNRDLRMATGEIDTILASLEEDVHDTYAVFKTDPWNVEVKVSTRAERQQQLLIQQRQLEALSQEQDERWYDQLDERRERRNRIMERRGAKGGEVHVDHSVSLDLHFEASNQGSTCTFGATTYQSSLYLSHGKSSSTIQTGVAFGN